METQHNFCDICDISMNCNFSPSRGQGVRYSIAFIVPTISETEYKKGIFKNRRGKIINSILEDSNLEYYVTSLLKCPTNENPREFEINNCIGKLKKELFEVKPKIIITVGDVVTSKFLNYKFFKNVVNKPDIIELNNSKVIIYPIYNPKHKEYNNVEYFDKSFVHIFKLYKKVIDSNYLNLKLL